MKIDFKWSLFGTLFLIDLSIKVYIGNSMLIRICFDRKGSNQSMKPRKFKNSNYILKIKCLKKKLHSKFIN